MLRVVWRMTLAWFGFLAVGRMGVAETAPVIGRVVAPFSLADAYGQPFELPAEPKAVVVVFIGVECPLVKLYAMRLDELHAKFAPRGVLVVGVDANVQDTPSELQAFGRRHELKFPLLVDPRGALVESLSATRTPEAFVLDANWRVCYHGRIDDQFGVGYQRFKPRTNELADALEQVLAAGEVKTPETTAVGCFIGRGAREPNATPAESAPTYSEHVAAIFQKRCVDCHRDGEIAPFALTSYDNAVAWAETIAEVLGDGRMPPWFASPEFGHFSNTAQLPDDERQLVLDWIGQGCAEGDRKLAPPPKEFVSGWSIGKPDAVYYMSDEPFEVAARGAIDYQHYTIDPKFEEDMWVTASEALPGNREVVHHILVFAVPPGSSPSREFFQGHLVGAYAPGVPAYINAPGQAMLLPKGTRFVMQMHYTANGRKQQDRSYLGLKFCKASEVTQRIESGMAINLLLSIPPRAPNHSVRAVYRFPEDRLLLSLTPHMHIRGKAFRYEAVYPDGRQETLLDVPRYDFNWQITYTLSEPKLMPKGTRLRCTALYDNSEENLSNPNPNETVRFGLQTWEEMLIGWYTAAYPNSPQAAEPPDRQARRN